MRRYSRYSRYRTVFLKLEEKSYYFLYTKSSASAELFLFAVGRCLAADVYSYHRKLLRMDLAVFPRPVARKAAIGEHKVRALPAFHIFNYDGR